MKRAILAVVVLYRKKFFVPNRIGVARWQFYMKLVIGVLPALILGFIFSDNIDAMLESPTTEAVGVEIDGSVESAHHA